MAPARWPIEFYCVTARAPETCRPIADSFNAANCLGRASRRRNGLASSRWRARGSARAALDRHSAPPACGPRVHLPARLGKTTQLNIFMRQAGGRQTSGRALALGAPALTEAASPSGGRPRAQIPFRAAAPRFRAAVPPVWASPTGADGARRSIRRPLAGWARDNRSNRRSSSRRAPRRRNAPIRAASSRLLAGRPAEFAGRISSVGRNLRRASSPPGADGSAPA